MGALRWCVVSAAIGFVLSQVEFFPQALDAALGLATVRHKEALFAGVLLCVVVFGLLVLTPLDALAMDEREEYLRSVPPQSSQHAPPLGRSRSNSRADRQSPSPSAAAAASALREARLQQRINELLNATTSSSLDSSSPVASAAGSNALWTHQHHHHTHVHPHAHVPPTTMQLVFGGTAASSGASSGLTSPLPGADPRVAAQRYSSPSNWQWLLTHRQQLSQQSQSAHAPATDAAPNTAAPGSGGVLVVPVPALPGSSGMANCSVCVGLAAYAAAVQAHEQQQQSQSQAKPRHSGSERWLSGVREHRKSLDGTDEDDDAADSDSAVQQSPSGRWERRGSTDESAAAAAAAVDAGAHDHVHAVAAAAVAATAAAGATRSASSIASPTHGLAGRIRLSRDSFSN